jgi:putative transposase
MQMIAKQNQELSVTAQCDMLNVSRSSYYEYIKEPVAKDVKITGAIGIIYAKRPSYGRRRITEILQRQGVNINPKRTQRLMRSMKIQGVCPKPKLSTGNRDHQKYPYIAREKPIVRINQVWSIDITYVKTKFGYVYLIAIIDWHSRFIIAWGIFNCMDEGVCIEVLERALQKGTPDIFNTDQGAQFTGNAFLSVLTKNGIRPSMDGKGRATDNAHIERFWRSVKWEEVYLYEPQAYSELKKLIGQYIKFYNHERPHQSLDYMTPSEVHFNLKRKDFDFEGNPVYTEEELKYVLTW